MSHGFTSRILAKLLFRARVLLLLHGTEQSTPMGGPESGRPGLTGGGGGPSGEPRGGRSHPPTLAARSEEGSEQVAADAVGREA
jgi:hypothetical protein